MTDQINTRELVLDILLAVTRDGEFSHIAIRNVLDKYRYLSKQERAFITRLSEGTLERRIELDYIINQFSKTKVNKMKPVIRCILRSGVYQLKYMDAVPDRAACNEAVKLAVKRGFSGLRGFVNGVMRNISRNLSGIVYPDPEKEPIRAVSIQTSMPEWLVERFVRQFGMECAAGICKNFLKDRDTSVRVDVQRISREEVKEQLIRQGVTVRENPAVSCGLFLSGYDVLDTLQPFQDGVIYIQDPASMLVAEQADPKTGNFVLDVCAAPGGKSIHMAEKLAGTGMVEARDLTEYKVGLIEENIERSGLENIRARQWDARMQDKEMLGKADIVLADLPCSGLGVIGSKTDIKYNASEEKIQELSALQREILNTVEGYVKQGGTLMYSTCTITAEENQENVEWFLNEHPDFVLESSQQILPETSCDGFFIAKMKRKTR